MQARQRLVAVVACSGYAFEDQGSRSERVVISVRGIAGLDGPAELSRYSQGDPIFAIGGAYLIAACDQRMWAPAWRLVEWHAISAEQAHETLARARARLDQALTRGAPPDSAGVACHPGGTGGYRAVRRNVAATMAPA